MPPTTTSSIFIQALANDHPFAKRKGLKGATESVFRLTRR